MMSKTINQKHVHAKIFNVRLFKFKWENIRLNIEIISVSNSTIFHHASRWAMDPYSQEIIKHNLVHFVLSSMCHCFVFLILGRVGFVDAVTCPSGVPIIATKELPVPLICLISLSPFKAQNGLQADLLDLSHQRSMSN